MADMALYEDFTREEVEDLTDKIITFTEILCFTPPSTGFYPYQMGMARAIVRDVLWDLGNTLSGLFARQSGKSETVANTAAAMMVILPKLANLRDEKNHFVFPQLRKFTKGFWVGIFSPSTFQSGTTYSRLRSRLTSPTGREILSSPEFAPVGEKELLFTNNSGTFLSLNNGSFCYSMSAEKSANIESKTFHLILLDESQDLDEFKVGKSIMPMGASTNATSVATGTPGMTKSFFYKMIALNRRLDAESTARAPQPLLHFHNDYRVVQRSNPQYKKYIKKEKMRLGEESDEFRMAYKLEWLLERGMAVPESLFQELGDKDRKPVTSYDKEPLVAGLDFGKSNDSTVLTIGRPLYDQADDSGRVPVEVIHWWEKVGDDYEAIFAELKDKLADFSIETIACDATGTGEPLVDRLTWELPQCTVIPVKFSSQSKDHLYKNFLLMIQEKKVRWPAHARTVATRTFKMFKAQMLDLQKEYKNNYLSCHAPEDQRNAHDDFPDSLALMLWCIHEEAMPYVDQSEDNFYQGQNWYKATPSDPGSYGHGQRFSLRG